MGEDERKHGEEDCSRFPRDFEDWMNMNEQERTDVVSWLTEDDFSYLLVKVLSLKGFKVLKERIT